MLSESISEDGSTSNSQQDMQIAAEARIQAKIDLLDNAVVIIIPKFKFQLKWIFQLMKNQENHMIASVIL